MIKQWIFLFTVMLIVPGCKKGPPDGNYCAKIIYQNPEAKKQSSYTLIVAVKDNKLTDISFPEGHHDTTEITPVEIPENGKLVAASKAGFVYKIEMKGPAEKCMNAVNMIQCKGKSKDGNRCKRFTGNKIGYCYQHKDQMSK